MTGEAYTKNILPTIQYTSRSGNNTTQWHRYRSIAENADQVNSPEGGQKDPVFLEAEIGLYVC